MENTPPNPKLPEKKPARQSSNLVWAFLGLGVLLLLLVTVLNSDTEQEISWSQFEKLIKASNPQNKDRTGYIDIKDTTGADSKQFRISDLHDIVVGLNNMNSTFAIDGVEPMEVDSNTMDLAKFCPVLADMSVIVPPPSVRLPPPPASR